MKNKAKVYMIIGISFLVIALISSTLAYYVWTTDSLNETKIVTNVGGASVYFDGGSSIVNEKIRPVESYEYGIKKEISVKADTTGLTFNLYLDITSLPMELRDESFRYVIYKSDTKISEGNFSDDFLSENLYNCSKNDTNHLILLEDETLSTTKVTYVLYIWIDGLNYVNSDMMMNKEFCFDLHAEGIDALLKEGKIPDITTYPEEQKQTLAYKILSDYYYADKLDVSNNGIKYHYDTNHNLMADIDSNVRYYGGSPNNYIYFNCNDYNNQTSSTCEVWRIIGVFNDKVKIIRNSSIGMYSFDNRGTSSGAETIYGSNNWTISRLMMLLNSGYDSETGGSLYWNRLSGNCYSGSSAVDNIKTCDLSNVGLKNDTTRNLIKEHTYSLLGYESPSLYANEAYEMEQETGSVSTGRPTSWTGKIALMYPSDYGYGADFSVDACSSSRISNYYGCRNNNWLYNGKEWLLTPKSGGYTAKNNAIDTNANVTVSLSAYGEYDIRPVLYISSSLEIESGTGSSTNPYQLKVN